MQDLSFPCYQGLNLSPLHWNLGVLTTGSPRKSLELLLFFFLVLVALGLHSEKAMAPHSSTLAWKIPWTEEPGRLQSMGSWRVRHDWVTSLSLSCIGEGNGNSLQCSCLENPSNRGAWWAAVYGIAQSRTRLKRLSRSSRSSLLHTGFL